MPVEQLFFTDLPRGKGLDPNSAGYQIKACSAGLSPDARRQLDSICRHYGDVVHRHAPRTAQKQEMDWQEQARSLGEVPPKILEAFPQVWTYDRLEDGLFALTCIRYTGLTHDGRTGNFFAHAMVFSPDSLATHGHHPLALSRSTLFRSNDPSDDTQIPPYSDLGSPVAPGEHHILRDESYQAQLAAMVSALCSSTPLRRPVLICLTDWRQAAPLLEALLDLLPPAARRRLTFCTYESDPKWLIPTATGERPTHLAAAHDLLVLCRTDERSFNLPIDYQSTYAVFNFVDQSNNNVGEPRGYATFAATCVLKGDMKPLKEYHHDLVAQLGFNDDPEAWDALVPAAALHCAQPPAGALVAAVQSLVALAKDPQQARIALEWLVVPRIKPLADPADADKDYAEELAALSPHLATLVDRVMPTAEANQTPDPVRRLQDMALDALKAGRACTAAALLTACGKSRDDTLIALLNNTVRDRKGAPLRALHDPDREPLVDLLLNGLRLAEQTSAAELPLAEILKATFLAAQDAGCERKVWEGIGGKLVKAHWQDKGISQAEKRALVQHVVACVPVTVCPEANAWLNLRLLEATPPQSDEQLTERLKDIAQACAQSAAAEAETLTQDALRLTREQLREPQRCARVFGRIAAEVTHGTATWETLFAAYRHEMGQTTSSKQFEIRQSLAEETPGMVHVLCHDLLADVLPWRKDESHRSKDNSRKDNSHNTFRAWQDTVLKPHPKLLDNVRQEVARRLAEPEQVAGVFPLAEALIPKQPDEQAASGLVDLYNAVALLLPLEPLTRERSQALAPPPNSMAKDAQARVRVMQFMREVEERARKNDWSTMQFPHNDTVWHNDLRLLASEDKEQALLKWCPNTFATVGVNKPQEAKGLVTLLESAGEKAADSVGPAVAHLLKERDLVTCVGVATQFALCILEGSEKPATWGPIVQAIVEPWDKSTRRHFEAHLAGRFGRHGEEYNKRLVELCNVAGLSRPKFPKSPGPALSPWSRVTGLLDWAKRPWRKLRGGSTQSGND